MSETSGEKDEVCTPENSCTRYWESELCKVCYPENPSRAVFYHRTWNCSYIRSDPFSGGLTGHTLLPIHKHPGSKCIYTAFNPFSK